jgi:oligopeptide/dipeptide ABC transporter ATP-binding protein
MTTSLLEIQDLTICFPGPNGLVPAVDGVSLTLEAGTVLGIVGESGSGKTMTALAVMRLLPRAAKVTSGSICFKGRDLLQLSMREMRKIRGAEISMVWQEPMSSFNPFFRLGGQVAEALSAHRIVKGREALRRVIELFRSVKIPGAEDRCKDYPFQFSGGMLQRAMIAMALSCNPDIVIADEPTTALDVTVQRQILDLLEDLKEEYDTAVILISHSMGVISDIADEVLMMYSGMVLEKNATEEILTSPAHPYTKALLQSVPKMTTTEKRLAAIPGAPPNIFSRPSGCPFHPRCPNAGAACSEEKPIPRKLEEGHLVACHNAYT